jgi:transposase
MLDALLADRDAKIESLAERLARVEDYVRGLTYGRQRCPADSDGQGLLFDDANVRAEDRPSETEEANDDGDEDDGPPSSPRPKKRRSRSKPDLSCLPTREVLHELPESERICPETGIPLVPIGEKIIEEIHFEPSKLMRTLHRHIIYGPAPEQALDRKIKERCAAGPARAIDDCIASAALLAWLLTQKFLHHIPLYRQASIFERDGLKIPRSTLSDWALRSAELLEPIAQCLDNQVRAGPVMQLDDTPVQCQRGRGEKNFQAYLWTIVNPDVSGVVYRFTAGRSSELIVELFEKLDGDAVGDGYSGNKSAARKSDERSSKPKCVRLGGCWSHTTRKFRDAESESEKIAKLFRRDIKALYRVDEMAREQANKWGLNEHRHRNLLKKIRRKHAPQILSRIFHRAEKLQERFSDSGKMGEALKYLLNQRLPLQRFLTDGRIPLDNNACERAIRPIAIGRRNWLFAGSERGGKAAAVIYTLIESCKIANVNPQAYLADVLIRVSTHPANRTEELLPSNWAALLEREAVPAAA